MKRLVKAVALSLAVAMAAPVALSGFAASAKDVQRIEWDDLRPPLSPAAEQAAAELNLRIDQMTDREIAVAMDRIEAEGSALIPDLDDTTVELEGYLVPLDFDAETMTDFVLVPYFGACIHVPPPPVNQTVFVKFREGIGMADFEKNFYSSFRVKGKIKVARTKTNLAEVGYQVTADDIVVGE